MNPYHGASVEQWRSITEKLVSKHPLATQIADLCLKSWQSILHGKINTYLNMQIKEMSISPQATGALLHDVIPEYISKNISGFRKGTGNEKDVVCKYDDTFSFEIKTSSQKSIYGNRSYAKSDTGKEKSGYYLTINFEKISSNDPKILLIQMGWLDHSDWVGQKSETGQQASLLKEARENKLIVLYKEDVKMSEYPYQDRNLSFKERAEDLVSRMTAEEMASQLRYDAPAIDRLGIPAYHWWNEALHGVARAGTATVFPQAIALAAVFDRNFMRGVAEVIAAEGRAKYNENVRQGDRDIYKGLTFWSPNVNIFRDPRWGRGHETYGEDPYLTSRLGVEFVKGLQGDGKYLKTAACAKHYAVHSGPEDDRHHFDAIASKQDMADTYLPAFKALVQEAKVEAVMGAYNRTNGEPCCGSKTLLIDILREEWGFDGHVTSDCWALKDFHQGHNVTKTITESAAMALKNGCDLCCGYTYLHLMESLAEGLITEDDLRAACVRMMTTRMRLGMFDGDCEYDNIQYEVNDCPEHHGLALEAAKKSMVLLKNNGVLPLKKSEIRNLAVIGPNARSEVALKANYSGTPSRYTTILEGFQDYLEGGARVWYSAGSHLYKERVENLGLPDDRIGEAVAMAQRSDAVILCVGLDASMEGEQNDTGVPTLDAGGDKKDLELPASQLRLMEAVIATGKPVIIALLSGSSTVLGEAGEKAAAIIQCWYPGQEGGKALAQLVFGDESFSGRLPVTFYKSTEELPDFSDYAMEGRTYRYMKNEPLYPFGYGLSYVKFEYSNLRCNESIKNGERLEVRVDIKNTGNMAADEVAELYIRDEKASVRVPKWSLCGFERVRVAPGKTETAVFTVTPYSMEVCGLDGKRFVEPGEFTLFAGGSQPDAVSERLTGAKAISVKFRVED